MKTLHCVLKKEWFEKIKSGVKTHEYREVKYFWQKRIFIHPRSTTPKFDKVRFTLGMTSEKDKTMLFKIKSVTACVGTETDLKTDKWVYDIELGERLE